MVLRAAAGRVAFLDVLHAGSVERVWEIGVAEEDQGADETAGGEDLALVHCVDLGHGWGFPF